MENDANKLDTANAEGDGAVEENISSKQYNDDDLDDLLDSALEDFEKGPVILSDEKQNVQINNIPDGDPSQTETSADLPPEDEALFNELFNAAGSDDGQQALEEVMKKLISGEPEILQHLESMAQNLETVIPPADSTASVDSTLQQTLENLAQNVQGLQEEPQDEEILRILSDMRISDDGASGSTPDWDFIPMMQNMMKSLMSKEVLYPSLKDIADKYPRWLEENSAKLTEKEKDNYCKQYELMKTIVQEYESETSEDSDDTKKRRFEKIMDTMQRMQELGQPPKDLVGEMPAGIEVDENGLPKLPGSLDQCSLM